MRKRFSKENSRCLQSLRSITFSVLPPVCFFPEFAHTILIHVFFCRRSRSSTRRERVRSQVIEKRPMCVHRLFFLDSGQNICFSNYILFVLFFSASRRKTAEYLLMENWIERKSKTTKSSSLLKTMVHPHSVVRYSRILDRQTDTETFVMYKNCTLNACYDGHTQCTVHCTLHSLIRFVP